MQNYSSGLAKDPAPTGSSNSSSRGRRSVWSITREQLNYYTTQFFCLQSDPLGVVPGAAAKEFFVRSKLPITDLRGIWQLSDVSQVFQLENFEISVLELHSGMSLRFCFVVKTSADNVISQIFDIFANKFRLFSTQLSFYALIKSIELQKDSIHM